jgi:hypothetical protein
MANKHSDSPRPRSPSLRDLFPTLSERELKQAEGNFSRYLEIALQVYREQLADARGFDSSPYSNTMEERSKESLKN